jgi:hypothetical protein
VRYVTEEELAHEVQRSIAHAVREQREINPVHMARLVKLQKKKAQEAGLLITAQQGSDRASGRSLTSGDRARYVGPSRIEDTLLGPVERPHGQTGFIIEAHGQTIKFLPDDGSVSLVVRTQPPSYHLLERVP